jgi:AraC-like DNA-binding protein
MPRRPRKKSRVFPNPNPAIVHLNRAVRAGDEETPPLCQPTFTQFILNRMARPFVFGRHQHLEFEIILVVRGRYRCQLNDQLLEIDSNSVLVVQPGDWHEDYCDPPLEYAGLRFSFPRSAILGEDLRFFKSDVTPAEQHAKVPSDIYLPLLEKIADEASHADPASVHIQDAVLSELFWRLVRAYADRVLAPWLAPVPTETRFLERLQQCFAQNLHNAPTMPDLARMLGISQRVLSQRCATLLKTSPAKALLRLRVQYAHQLLTQTEMSVKEVSYRLGFSNPYHFSRVYKQSTGRPPSQDKPTDKVQD